MSTDVVIKGAGVTGSVEAQVDRTHGALRTSLRPAEVGVLGSYAQSFNSGVMAAGLAAGAPIFTMRWTSQQVWALVKRVRLTADTDGTAFAQGSTIFDLIRATGFTVQDTAGVALTMAGKSGAKSTRYAPSQIQIAASATGNFAIANTATLTAGTRTLDSNPLHIIVGGAGANPSISLVGTTGGLLIDPTETARQPLELQNNEGFVIRATVPGTGTWKFGVEVEWDEIDPARYFALFG